MKLSNFNFLCPHCQQSVVKDDVIELTTIRLTGEKGLIRMASEIGNYSFEHFPPLKFQDDECIGFSCPNCNVDLAAKDYPNYALLSMDVGNGITFDVIFSRMAGERVTKIITEDGIETYKG